MCKGRFLFAEKFGRLKSICIFVAIKNILITGSGLRPCPTFEKIARNGLQ